jgi:hypothetical protein
MTAGTAGAAPRPWHDSIREPVNAIWHALDRTQLALSQQSRYTNDDALLSFKRQFDRAADTVMTLTTDELYPLAEDTDVSEADKCPEP